MKRLFVLFTILMFSASSAWAGPSAPMKLKDLYFGEALYDAFQGDWFDAISRLDTELMQHYRVDEPERDTLHYHVNQAEFDVGDFELAYRMHLRAGRAIKAVIEGNVAETVRNEAIYRLARMYFRKDRPEDALHAVESIHGAVPAGIRADLAFLRANIDMANGRNADAVRVLKDLQKEKSLEGFSTYNLGIALLRSGNEQHGREDLDRTGRIASNDPAALAIKDKANLVLGDKLMNEKNFAAAKEVLDRVRLTGPFSDRALLGSGWADASRGQFERALVPWTILSERVVTDQAVQEAMIAVPYAYGKLGVYSKAALMYGRALEAFGREIAKLGASIASIREGKFLKALVRDELKQDPDWVVKLRELPDTPETFYLLDLMASHDFQESMKNYLDLEDLRKRLEVWSDDLAAYEDLIAQRRTYYQPLLPAIDREFRRLDSTMRLRLEQRDRIVQRLQNMLIAPRPDYLATAQERILGEHVARLEKALARGGTAVQGDGEARIKRLRGVLDWKIYTEYDQRFTEVYAHLRELNHIIDELHRQYTSFVRTRQAATQSYEGYDAVIITQRARITAARENVRDLMVRQGHILEVMAVNELTRRRDRLEELQIKARFAMADSYDRAVKDQLRKRDEQ
jgi:tetratricopeptide (TPR) repeat protein